MPENSSPFPYCFRPTTTTTTTVDLHPSSIPVSISPPTSGNPNLTTCLYQTDLGPISLTWHRNVIGRSLQIDLRFGATENDVSSSFHLHIKPFLFWRKNGTKKFDFKNSTKKIQIFWNLNKAKFGSDPEPKSGFYVAVLVEGVMILLIGDSQNEAYNRTKAKKPENTQVLILRREHVFGTRFYSTKARFGGKTRDISIDCSVEDEPGLCFSIDGEKVLEIKKLKWKFRGNEKIEIDGIPIHVSWDVYNWLFKGVNEGHAVFLFRFENLGFEVEEEEEEMMSEKVSGMISCGFGINGFERCRLKKRSYKTRSSSSSSMSSSVSSGCSSSVMEWANMEETELQTGPSGFSLLIYAWKS
ncbi:Protein of unknown function DUF868 [Macleaya cordata]|uniref:DUF868 domain-containing protein n=1 Tax=Macleaya cordata TaxID=56857 RepID=A0A200PT17_MACCD|nr:Protein of unknown function DUF868 [Macleaya cordata]